MLYLAKRKYFDVGDIKKRQDDRENLLNEELFNC